MRLAVQNRRKVFLLTGGRHLAAGVQLQDGEPRHPLIPHRLFERRPLGTTDQRRPGIGLSVAQQRLGVTIEVLAGHQVGIDKETPQTVQALLLVLKAFFDTAVAFTGE